MDVDVLNESLVMLRGVEDILYCLSETEYVKPESHIALAKIINTVCENLQGKKRETTE